MASTTLPTPAPQTPFDTVAEAYDEVFTNSLVGQAQRRAVWRELDQAFLPGQRVLELNCGTGVDALHLAQRGVPVMACDVSPCMIDAARVRIKPTAALARINFRVLSNADIAQLSEDGPYDGAFSNFAGMNCVPDLRPVACDLARLLRPGAAVLICMFGRVVVWEMIWYLAQAKPERAFRRFRASTEGRLTDGPKVEVYYPSIRKIVKAFTPQFRLRRWRGIGVAVPPSYWEPLVRRFPAALVALEKVDRFLGRCPLAKSMGDHILLEFERSDR